MKDEEDARHSEGPRQWKWPRRRAVSHNCITFARLRIVVVQMLFLPILSFIAAVSWTAMASSGRASEAGFEPFTVPPNTVDSLNTTLFLGRWYQMYSSLVPNTTFERNGSCVFADLAPSKKPGVAFQLTNSQR